MSDQAPSTQRPPRREHEEGGLLAPGTEVQVTYGRTGSAGTIISVGAVPAAHIVLELSNGAGRRLIFCSSIDYIAPHLPHPAMG